MSKRPPAKSDRPLNEDEASLFERAMSGVERMPAAPKPPAPKPPPKGRALRKPAPIAPELQETPAVPREPKPRHAAVEVTKLPLPPHPARPDRRGSAAGVDRRTAQRLVRGQLRIEDRIDLHGMTQEEARRALDRFLSGAASDDKRCVLVITGKGSARDSEDSIMPDRDVGVLRRSLPRWLSQPGLSDLVVAYHNAKPKDGGDGAFYILLRRRRS